MKKENRKTKRLSRKKDHLPFLLNKGEERIPFCPILTKKSTSLFISYAHEDKECIAKPLANFLVKSGFSVWYDEFSIFPGDSIKQQIDKGIAISEYGIVILSANFFRKHWTKEELDGFVSLEYTRKKKVIIPLLFQMTVEELAKHSPSLAGKKVIIIGDDIKETVEEIIRTINYHNFTRFRSSKNTDELIIHTAGHLAVVRLAKDVDISWEKFGEQIGEEIKKIRQDG